MTQFKKYKLGELGKVITGKTPESKFPKHFGNYMPFITPSDFGDYIKSAESAKRYVSKEGAEAHNNKILPENSVLVTCIGSDMGKVVINKKTCLTNQQINSIIPNRKIIDHNFLYYSIINLYDLLRSIASDGTTMPIINKTDFEEIEVDVPNLPTQTLIASMLSSLDDKIELNSRTNQTLEQIAQTLFKKYFVDDIDSENLPEGWRLGKLGEMIELVYGKSLKEENRNGGEFPVVGSSGIVGYHDSFIAKENGIVVGRKGNAGAVIWLHKNFFPIDTTFYVSDLVGAKDMHYYYFLLKSIDLLGLNSDSAVPGLNRNEAHFQDVIIPEKKKIIEFNKVASDLFDKISSNENANGLLIKLRDSLLPKLMSGEIEVNAIENELAEA